jgi:hypothetical protein
MKAARLTAASVHLCADLFVPVEPSLLGLTGSADSVIADTAIVLSAIELSSGSAGVRSADFLYVVLIRRTYTLYKYDVHHYFYGV